MKGVIYQVSYPMILEQNATIRWSTVPCNIIFVPNIFIRVTIDFSGMIKENVTPIFYVSLSVRY